MVGFREDLERYLTVTDISRLSETHKEYQSASSFWRPQYVFTRCPLDIRREYIWGWTQTGSNVARSACVKLLYNNLNYLLYIIMSSYWKKLNEPKKMSASVVSGHPATLKFKLV